jgi:glycosyltransferase involved in cell wall biosynthesis
MSCGLPVIASRRGGITEVIDRPGENGLLVTPARPAELVRAMRSLVDDPALRTRLAAGARARVLETYTMELMVERTLAVYGVAGARLGAETARSQKASTA